MSPDFYCDDVAHVAVPPLPLQAGHSWRSDDHTGSGEVVAVVVVFGRNE